MSQFKTFEESRERANTPRGDLVALRGKRLVYASENDKEVRLAEALIKGVTGNDPLTARQLHKEEITFTPTFKLWLACNNKPVIKGTDDAIWERVLFVPWARYFKPDERDPHLFEKLKKEASGILNWALNGCTEWQRQGLNPPKEVQAAIQEYRHDMDSIARFLEEYCEASNSGKIQSSILYQKYESFCQSEGEEQQNQKSFSEKLSRLGHSKKHTKSGAVWYGLSFKR